MIFDGKKLAEEIKQSLRNRIETYTELYHRRPCLNVMLVGDDYGSQRYVSNCEKQTALVGMDCRVVRLPQESTEDEVLTQLNILNHDNNVDGILIQMPLPKHINTEHVVEAILPDKDVDGVTNTNVANLWKQKTADYSRFCVPCTPRSAMRILEAAEISLSGKKTVVVGRSNIVGLPVAKLLMNENATVTVAHSRTQNLPDLLRSADIIVAALGKAKFITADMVSKGSVIVDVGINADSETGKMCGDVDFANVADKCSMITPVPGGVGPLTICSLIENTLDCYLRHVTH